MIVLGIYGSPRKAGNTDMMLDAFLDGGIAAGATIERVYVRDMEIKGCLGCGYCDKHGVCVQKDDMARVYPLLETAHRIVVASPVYFYGLTGQLKLLVDRSQALYMKRELAKREGKTTSLLVPRKGFFLSIGATRGKRLFDCCVLTARYFFDALSVEYYAELCFREMEEKGSILNHPKALEECRLAGKAFAARE